MNLNGNFTFNLSKKNENVGREKKKKEMRNCLNKGWGIWWEIGMTFLDPVRDICHNYTHIYMLVHQSICLYTTKIKPTRNDEK